MRSNANRSVTARIGGLALHVKYDSREIAAHARKGLDKKFEWEALIIDPTLTGLALERKIDLIKRLYFTRLAARSSRKRTKS
jgi:hypothetical protein